MWTYFIIVPLDTNTIQHYNAFQDCESVLITVRESLTTSNTDVTIVQGDGPMPLARGAVPIRVNCNALMDADGQDRHYLISQGILVVSDWLHQFWAIGEFPPILDLLLIP
jgi:hypothetical protein